MIDLINILVFNIGFIKRQHLLENYYLRYAKINKIKKIKPTQKTQIILAIK